MEEKYRKYKAKYIHAARMQKGGAGQAQIQVGDIIRIPADRELIVGADDYVIEFIVCDIEEDDVNIFGLFGDENPAKIRGPITHEQALRFRVPNSTDEQKLEVFQHYISSLHMRDNITDPELNLIPESIRNAYEKMYNARVATNLAQDGIQRHVQGNILFTPMVVCRDTLNPQPPQEEPPQEEEEEPPQQPPQQQPPQQPPQQHSHIER